MLRADLNLSMTRNLLRAVVAVAISFVLLYYSVAWAVLRCSHDAKHAEYEVALQDPDPTHEGFHGVDPDLECPGSNFHTEAMAEASFSRQLDRLLLDMTPHINDFPTLRIVTANAEIDTWLKTGFESSRLLAFLISLPSYLFLSILRI
jgi:hypothetical protein